MNDTAPRFEIEPALAEAAVLLALKSHPESLAFRRERDPLYLIEDFERRDEAFDALHVRWFEALGFARPVTQALAGEERVIRETSGCLLRRARRPQEEGVELLVRSDEVRGRTVRILLQPSAFLSPAALLGFLRQELLHVADMLDPAFGYTPSLAWTQDEGPPAKLLLDRYSVLWNATVDGRLERRGWTVPGARERRWREFRRTFPMLGEVEARTRFDGFYASDRPHHLMLTRFARDPRAPAGEDYVAGGATAQAK